MKKAALTLSAIAGLAAYAGSAGAQCDFNAVAKAGGMNTSLVRAFGYNSGSLRPVPNVVSSAGIPGWSPVSVLEVFGEATPYVFDVQTGGCDVRSKVKIERDCALLEGSGGAPLGLPTGPCHVTYVKAKCNGILQADGLTPINAADDSGWSLYTLTRSSFNDPAGGDMTSIDFPLSFDFEAPSNGRIKLDSSSAEALAAVLIDVDGAALPTCTSVQILKVGVKDPQGLPFAVMGTSTRAKGD